MNVVHRDLKLANILINFHKLEVEKVLESGHEIENFKRTTSLIGNVDVVIADLGFAK